MLSTLGIMGPLLFLLSVSVPVLCTLFFFHADKAMWSPCTFFFHRPIILRFVQNQSMGDGSYHGWSFCYLHLNNCGCFSRGFGQEVLASNRIVEAGMMLGHGVSSLVWRVVTVHVASDCCLCWGMLQLGTDGFSSTWGLPVG